MKIALYVCPECGDLYFPQGNEREDGPPECDHGLLFGSTPDGGGECECDLIWFQPVKRAWRIPPIRDGLALERLLGRHTRDNPRPKDTP